jgi:hypothetical protein
MLSELTVLAPPEFTVLRPPSASGWNLEHDPEKWIPVFGKDYASTKT